MHKSRRWGLHVFWLSSLPYSFLVWSYTSLDFSLAYFIGTLHTCIFNFEVNTKNIWSKTKSILILIFVQDFEGKKPYIKWNTTLHFKWVFSYNRSCLLLSIYLTWYSVLNFIQIYSNFIQNRTHIIFQVVLNNWVYLVVFITNCFIVNVFMKFDSFK